MSEFSLHVIPARADNYIYVLRDHSSGTTLAVDPSEAAPLLRFLEEHHWPLHFILNTHHHYDHVSGNAEVKQATGAKVVAYEGDRDRIPEVDRTVAGDERVPLGSFNAHILFIPGHTLGHIAYHFEKEKLLFCGDTLFSLGCGRLFEGTAEAMTDSLQRLMALPEDTSLCCGHEYTLQNGRFALSADPQNRDLKAYLHRAEQLRKNGMPTVPSRLGDELKCNPFLRAIQGEVGEAENPAERFRLMRERKDCFA